MLRLLLTLTSAIALGVQHRIIHLIWIQPDHPNSYANLVANSGEEQLWDDKPLSRIFEANMRDWAQLNPGWKTKLWLQADVLELLRDHSALDIPTIVQADLARILILIAHGGVYVDIDTVPVRSLKALMAGPGSECAPGFDALVVSEGGGELINNFIWAPKPNSELLSKILQAGSKVLEKERDQLLAMKSKAFTAENESLVKHAFGIEAFAIAAASAPAGSVCVLGQEKGLKEFILDLHVGMLGWKNSVVRTTAAWAHVYFRLTQAYFERPEERMDWHEVATTAARCIHFAEKATTIPHTVQICLDLLHISTYNRAVQTYIALVHNPTNMTLQQATFGALHTAVKTLPTENQRDAPKMLAKLSLSTKTVQETVNLALTLLKGERALSAENAAFMEKLLSDAPVTAKARSEPLALGPDGKIKRKRKMTKKKVKLEL
jgi:hypothetical protein